MDDENNGEYTRINWNPPGTDRGDSVSTKNATLALKTAIAVARAFDANCALRNPAKECTIPMFEPQELVLGEPLRSNGFFTDLALRGIKLTRNLQHGEFSEDEEEFRARFAERSIDGHYAVKFLQKGIYNSVHAASAASDMMMETKILMNLAPHPNICQIYGVTAAGSDAFLSGGKEGFYIILDRLTGTMIQRIAEWKDEQQQNISTRRAKGEDEKAIALNEYQKLMQRLEVALDIGSALLFLSDRQIVFHLRPDKVGFDVRYGRIKLCDFGQARENGQLDQAPSLTKTDDIRTLAYTAPEVLCQAPVTVAADVYAYGVVLWEMLSLQRPFEGMSRSEHFERVIMESERPPEAPIIPEKIQAFISKCWDPHLRPTMKKVYDTVEEFLLFQDEKPNISVVPALNRAASEMLVTAEDDPSKSSDSGRRPLRRNKTADAKPRPTSDQKRGGKRPDHQATSGTAEAEPMKDRSKGHHESGGRTSRRSRRTTTSGHERGKDKDSNHEELKDRSGKLTDGSMQQDESKNSHPGMKDKSKSGRVSRRSRQSIKKPSEEASQGTRTSEGDDDKAVEKAGEKAGEKADGEPRRRRKSLTSVQDEASESSDKPKGPAFGRSATTTAIKASSKSSK